MKKTLLSLGFVAFSLVASAQTVTSFEASEGFTVGPADGQVGWGVTEDYSDAGAISNAYASDGLNSLAIVGTGNIAGNVGAFSPVNVFNDDVVTVRYDVYFSDFSDTASDFLFGVQSISQGLLSANVRATYEGELQYLGYTSGTVLGWITVPGVALEAGQWYHFDLVHYFTGPEPHVDILFGGVIVGTTAIYGATNVEQLFFLNDDYESTAYIDNVVVGAGNLAVKPVSKANVAAVYPNPATNVVNIAAQDATLASVTIADLNGRVVKNVKLNTTDVVQVNISDLSNGVYTMSITTDRGSEVKKIVKN